MRRGRVMFTGPYGVGENGTWQEWLLVRPEHLALVPDAIDEYLEAEILGEHGGDRVRFATPPIEKPLRDCNILVLAQDWLLEKWTDQTPGVSRQV
jgi:hypothetical protein